MSFSSIVKNELCRTEANGTCCMYSELAAVIGISGVARVMDSGEANIRIVTENAAFARKVFSAIKRVFDINPEVITRKSRKLKKHTSYILVVTSSMGAARILQTLGMLETDGDGRPYMDSTLYTKKILRKSCCRKSYLRGAFLAGGSISDPEKSYHLEITTHTRELAAELGSLINSFRSNDLNAKIVKRNGNYVTYLKEGENIVDFLNIIGAHNALLELENVRILKDMRNNVNRIVNCETANLEKTVNASFRQIENIRYIKETIGLHNLPENLQEIAELRLQYTDANLKELGDMLTPPLGKSGVNHRLRKLDKIAESFRT